MNLRRSAALSICLLFGLLGAACDRSLPDDSPAVATPVQDPAPSEPAAARPPEPPATVEATVEPPAVDHCADHESPEAQSDCLAEAALAADDLSVNARSALCDDAPRPLRCEYLFATNHSGARLCDQHRFAAARTYFRECDFLQVVTGLKERCDHTVFNDFTDERPEPCNLPLPDHRPTTGDELDELLTDYFLALAEASIARVPGSECPDLMRDEALLFIQQATELNERARTAAQAEHFAEALKTRVAYHELTGTFDPATWEGLRDVLTLSPMHGPGVVAHVTPTDRLELRADGTFHLRRNLRYSPEDPNQFEDHEGPWRVVSAVPGEAHAIIDLDGKEYAFGKYSGPSLQYFLHPRDSVDEPGLTYEFFDEDYFGEAC